MSVNLWWVSDDSEPTLFGDNDAATSPLLLNFFEIYPEDYEGEERTNVENSAIYPDFVRDFEKRRDFVPMSYEEGRAFLEENGGAEWGGPAIDSREVEAWAQAWIEILSDCDDDIKDSFELRARGFDWTAEVLEDLRKVQSIAERARKDGSTLHLEIF